MQKDLGIASELQSENIQENSRWLLFQKCTSFGLFIREKDITHSHARCVSEGSYTNKNTYILTVTLNDEPSKREKQIELCRKIVETLKEIKKCTPDYYTKVSPSNPYQRDWCNQQEICKYLGISGTTLYKYESLGMPVVRMEKQNPRYSKKECDKWFKSLQKISLKHGRK